MCGCPSRSSLLDEVGGESFHPGRNRTVMSNICLRLYKNSPGYPRAHRLLSRCRDCTLGGLLRGALFISPRHWSLKGTVRPTLFVTCWLPLNSFVVLFPFSFYFMRITTSLPIFLLFEILNASSNFSIVATGDSIDLYFSGYCWLGKRKFDLHHVHCNMSASAIAPLIESVPVEQQPFQVSTQVVTAGPAPSRFVIPFYFSLSGAGADRHFDPRTHTDLQQRLALFESVTLDSIEFEVRLAAGINRRVLACVTTSADSPANMLIGFPRLFLDGAQQFAVSANWTLPTDHSYGREIRSTAVGNPTPHFHFRYSGGVATSQFADVAIYGTLTVTTRGTGVPVPLTL